VIRVDHVVMAVRDVDVAAARLLEGHGLASVPGGRHVQWGTGNRIVPLGRVYLELLAVIDPEIARRTVLGRAIDEAAAGGDRWFAFCLADDGIRATAARLGLDVHDGERALPDGRVLRWRSAGIEDLRRTPDLPFFLEWHGPEDAHPGRAPVAHPAGAVRLAGVDVASNADRFRAWTGGAELPVRIVNGEAGIRAVRLETGGDPIVLT
jgi:hypothetical protein